MTEFNLTGTPFGKLITTAASLMLLVVASGCATNPVTGDSDFVLMSEEQEIAMGKQAHAQIMKQYSPYDDPALQAFVDRIGESLAVASHRKNLVFHFTVLDSPEVNAFALPGGYVYITRGIIAYMNSEEELAGVLGHEIGHVTARHSVRQHRDQTLAGAAGVVTAILTGSSAAADMVNMGGGALVRGYGRSHELEADRLGAEYLARTGYDPELMLKVVGILKDQEEFEIQRAREENREPRNYHGIFSTHPRNDQRLQEVIAAANQFRNPDAIHTDPGNFLRLLDGLTFGNGEDQGIVRDNHFYHKGLDVTVTFPSQWRIENQPTQLVAVRPDNAAAMIVQIDDQNRRETPAQYLHRKFKNITDGESLGYNSYTGITRAQTPFGNGPVRVTVVFHDKRIFILSGFAKGTRPDQEFISTANSIRHLSPDEQQLATSKHIKIIRAGSGDSFAGLARNTELGKYATEHLRLINGLYPDGEPPAGRLIKVIE